MRLTSRERRTVDDIRHALGSSLDIREVMARSAPLLLELIPADYVALGTAQTGTPALDWIAIEMPPSFFRAYEEMAPHDFVLRSVREAPGRVRRDSEMVSRADLEANIMYRRARDLGMPLEQVMATLLHEDREWLCGLSLYRTERHGFSERDEAILQALTPALTQAVENCRRFASVERNSGLLDALLSDHSLAAVFFVPPCLEVARTRGAVSVIDRWFDRGKCHSGVLPNELIDYVRAGPAEHEGCALRPFRMARDISALQVTLQRFVDRGQAHVALVFHEFRLRPDWTARLTPAEQKVAFRITLGWDNRLIADDLDCTVGAIKKHVTTIFAKLGVDQRAQLIALSHERGC